MPDIMDIFKGVDTDADAEIDKIKQELNKHNGEIDKAKGKITDLYKNLQKTVDAVADEQELMKIMNGEIKKVQGGIRKSLTNAENAFILAQKSWDNQMAFFKKSFGEIQKREYNLYIAHKDLATSWGVWAKTLESRNLDILNKSGYNEITIPVVKLKVKLMKNPIKLFHAIRRAVSYISDIFKASKVKIQRIEQETKALSDSFVNLFKSIGGVIKPRLKTTTSTSFVETQTAQQKAEKAKVVKKKKTVHKKRVATRRYRRFSMEDEEDESKTYNGNEEEGVIIR